MAIMHGGGWYFIFAGYCLEADALDFPSAGNSNTLSGHQYLGDAFCITTSESCGQKLFGDYMSVGQAILEAPG